MSGAESANLYRDRARAKGMTELERRIQIEETWARRRVMAKLMNFERRVSYIEKRAVACPEEPSPAWTGRYPPLDEKFDWPA
jgi:hypothetical protein